MNAINLLLILLKGIGKTAVDVIKIIFTKCVNVDNPSTSPHKKRITVIGVLLVLAYTIIALFEYIAPEIDVGATKPSTYTFKDGVITSDDETDVYMISGSYSIEDMILLSNTHLYTMEVLLNFSRDELRLIRNGIFALNKRPFVEEDLQKYYSQFDWYNPLPKGTVVDYSSLSEYQRKNVDLIKEIECYKRKNNFR